MSAPPNGDISLTLYNLKGKTNNKYEKMLKLMMIAYLVNSIVSIEQIEAAPLLFACAGMLEAERINKKI